MMERRLSTLSQIENHDYNASKYKLQKPLFDGEKVIHSVTDCESSLFCNEIPGPLCGGEKNTHNVNDENHDYTASKYKDHWIKERSSSEVSLIENHHHYTTSKYNIDAA